MGGTEVTTGVLKQTKVYLRWGWVVPSALLLLPLNASLKSGKVTLCAKFHFDFLYCVLHGQQSWASIATV